MDCHKYMYICIYEYMYICQIIIYNLKKMMHYFLKFRFKLKYKSVLIT